MKTFTASQLSHKPAEVLAEAKSNGVIIQRKNTNGDVMEEFILIAKCPYSSWLEFGVGSSTNDHISIEADQ